MMRPEPTEEELKDLRLLAESKLDSISDIVSQFDDLRNLIIRTHEATFPNIEDLIDEENSTWEIETVKSPGGLGTTLSLVLHAKVPLGNYVENILIATELERFENKKPTKNIVDKALIDDLVLMAFEVAQAKSHLARAVDRRFADSSGLVQQCWAPDKLPTPANDTTLFVFGPAADESITLSAEPSKVEYRGPQQNR